MRSAEARAGELKEAGAAAAARAEGAAGEAARANQVIDKLSVSHCDSSVVCCHACCRYCNADGGTGRRHCCWPGSCESE